MSVGQNVAPAKFRTGAARHRESLVYPITYAAGKSSTQLLNPWGYLSELQILFQLAIVVGTGGTVTDNDAAQSNFLPQIGLRSPQGEQIWSSNSRDLTDFAYRLNRSTSPFTDPNYVAWTPGAAGTYNINFRLRIPVALDDGSNFDLGLLQRQINSNQFALTFTMAQASDLVGSGTCAITSITGTFYIEEVYYDAVRPGQTVNGAPLSEPSFAQYIRLRSTNLGALVNGTNNVKYDTGPVLVDAMHRIINNSKADSTVANVQQIQLKANGGTEYDTRTGNRIVFDQADHLGKALRAGVYHEDFCDDTQMVNATMARDMINSNQATQLSFFVNYTGTPSGYSDIQTIYRELVTFGG